MTLLELTVVLLILITLAGLTMPYVGGTGRMAMCRATDATLLIIKEAIIGGASGPGFYGDTLGYYPKDTKDNDLTNINLTNLFAKPSGFNEYNPKTAVGWRGPYLQSGAVAPIGLDSSFSNVFDSGTNTSGTVHVAINDADANQVLDAWHRPIILQIPLDSNNGYAPNFDYARLVSAGPGSGLEAGNATIDTKIAYDSSVNVLPEAGDRNDDRVLYLRMSDPYADGNIPCDQL